MEAQWCTAASACLTLQITDKEMPYKHHHVCRVLYVKYRLHLYLHTFTAVEVAICFGQKYDFHPQNTHTSCVPGITSCIPKYYFKTAAKIGAYVHLCATSSTVRRFP